MTESQYPQYATKNGTPYTAYVVEAVGQTYSLDGGAWRGKQGTIGSYLTAEAAIEVAKREKTATCILRVIDTRADDAPKIIFEI